MAACDTGFRTFYAGWVRQILGLLLGWLVGPSVPMMDMPLRPHQTVARVSAGKSFLVLFFKKERFLLPRYSLRPSSPAH
jgi:hypothetical protein